MSTLRRDKRRVNQACFRGDDDDDDDDDGSEEWAQMSTETEKKIENICIYGVSELFY